MIFADTSFWVALHSRRDPRCPEAAALLHRHATSQLVTTSHVRGETWTFLRRRVGHGVIGQDGGPMAGRAARGWEPEGEDAYELAKAEREERLGSWAAGHGAEVSADAPVGLSTKSGAVSTGTSPGGGGPTSARCTSSPTRPRRPRRATSWGSCSRRRGPSRPSWTTPGCSRRREGERAGRAPSGRLLRADRCPGGGCRWARSPAAGRPGRPRGRR